MNGEPKIGITMGDPAGVGPEIVLKALERKEVLAACQPVIVGDASALRRAAAALGKNELALPATARLIDLKAVAPEDHVWGRVDARFGRAAAAYIEKAVRMAQAGDVDAVVTAPINKEALQLAGVPYPGHTEMVGALTGAKDYAMMLVGPRLRVIHVSTHVSLAQAIARVKQDRILKVIRLAQEALRMEGVASPRIAVAGLNPHAGEGGLFGDEERLEIQPAIAAAVADGIDATGPHPPDTVFWRAANGGFDVVVAMYHDQGHIPAKLDGFDRSVNVTVGAPIIRASVDHGTAFDIAGKGVASEESMAQAIVYAARLARRGGST